ncbi:hypothetical protein OV208_38740 [Corallococcus sp. bb12-1]|uniref:hypothetical protein n=1 Tax=Corallococcus sp. bb12-1 TaxID=2996784 RepID=UPI00226D739B|nr:hypothetical protein [Corallococcus sp. bb12-1]MCY1047300.1 hypothetical protein [Corallococcus sp. bb12-1]
MYRLCLLGCVLLLGACREKAPDEGALRVTVEYGSYKPACVRVEVQDSQGPRGETDIVQAQFKNDATKQVLVAVIRKPEWDRELSVAVSSFATIQGNRCDGPAVERFPSKAPIPIPPKEFARFDVKLVAVDKDQDGSPSSVGLTWTGDPDCDDEQKDVHPGAEEQCSETVDYDCDKLKACADPDCSLKNCTDGDLCATNKVCVGVGEAAKCSGGTPVTCPTASDVCQPQLACQPSTGECVPTGPIPSGIACDDGNPCTTGTTCANLKCVGVPVLCTTPASTCQDSTGTCNPVNGSCVYPPKPIMTSCMDGDACTTPDRCDGSGVCVGSPTPCTAPVCQKVLSGCVAQGTCQFETDPAQLNTPCGESPTGRPRVCDATGACVPFPYPTSNFAANDIQPTDIQELITTGDVVFDTDNGSSGTWTPPEAVLTLADLKVLPVSQAGGLPDAFLIPVRTLQLGGTLRIVGSHSVILAVFGDATLNHPILVNGRFENGTMLPGAGGHQSCSSSAGQDGSYGGGRGGGGGGAGGGTSGAKGGTGDNAGATSGNAGSARGSASTPLVGGCAGGAGGGMPNVRGGLGGAGGGAVQISVSRTLTVATRISASAAEGLGGNAQASSPAGAAGGGGGGSGGLVVLEAFQLKLTGDALLTANGGGGGEGGELATGIGGSTNNGANGRGGSETSNSVAAGGAGQAGNGGDGGDGGAGTTAPKSGGVGTSILGLAGSGAGGGGGGAAGQIHLFSMQTCTPLTGAVISPPPTGACPLP